MTVGAIGVKPLGPNREPVPGCNLDDVLATQWCVHSVVTANAVIEMSHGLGVDPK